MMNFPPYSNENEIPLYIEKIASHVMDAAYRIHTEYGPGLLEKSYEFCLFNDMKDLGFDVKSQVSLPIYHNEQKLEGAYRIDLIINNSLIIEIKSVESLQLVHKKQLLTYLKARGCRLGLLINFNSASLKDEIKRVINL
jgi:GxxExxY protein